jgi:hypothetical protein
MCDHSGFSCYNVDFYNHVFIPTYTHFLGMRTQVVL